MARDYQTFDDRSGRRWFNPSVVELMKKRALPDEVPQETLRRLARQMVAEAKSLGWTGMPFDPELLAELQGIEVKRATIDIRAEARLMPLPEGRLQIEYAPDAPETRRRFSICHEIAHTFFPDCYMQIQHRRLNQNFDPVHAELELLCHIGAGSLRRKIDIVIGNWWHTDLFKKYGSKIAKGVNILDSKVPEQLKNKPFWHNYEINKKDEATKGLRKAIRLLKTLKYDADSEIPISSYDIASLAWNMSEDKLKVAPGEFLQLAMNVSSELRRMWEEDSWRQQMNVPNGMRKVFGTNGATISGLHGLRKALEELLGNIARNEALQRVVLAEKYASSTQGLWNEVLPPSVKQHSF